jgi:NAD(P)-dependent dehydrogenase (short-subunit alcohol dehydrogenase family)
MTTKPLDNKTALITGAASGIGKATANRFAKEGARVALADINREGLEAAAQQIITQGGEARGFLLDVTSEINWEHVINDIINDWLRLDILINNAGISFAKPITEMSLNEWQRVMNINLDGVFLGTKYAIQAMRKTGGGSIVNVASASGIKASPTASAYSASKAAVRMFTKVAALECADANIRVNSVSPSGVITPIWESMEFWENLKTQAGSNDAALQTLAQGVPLKRFATAEEIARAILYLASDESRFVTAADLVIDGGFTA